MRQIEEEQNNPLWNNMSQLLFRSQTVFVPSEGARWGRQHQHVLGISVNTTRKKNHTANFYRFWSLPNIFGSIFGAHAALLSITALWRSPMFMWHNEESLNAMLKLQMYTFTALCSHWCVKYITLFRKLWLMFNVAQGLSSDIQSKNGDTTTLCSLQSNIGIYYISGFISDSLFIKWVWTFSTSCLLHVSAASQMNHADVLTSERGKGITV